VIHFFCLFVFVLCFLFLFLFCIALLLPSGFGGSPIEVLTGFSKTESKPLGKKSGCTKGIIKCIGKQKFVKFLLLIQSHCVVGFLFFVFVFNIQADRTNLVHLYFTPTLCILFGNLFSWISFERMVSYCLYLVMLQRILELFILCSLA